jgi:hypothetical protein
MLKETLNRRQHRVAGRTFMRVSNRTNSRVCFNKAFAG